MKPIKLMPGQAECLIITVVILLCFSKAYTAVDSSAGNAKVGYQWDSNKIARAKEIFAFEEHEKSGPRYRSAITNWNPVLIDCDGVKNFKISYKDGNFRRFYGFRESERAHWAEVNVECFPSSRAAHEWMITRLSNPVHTWEPKADWETKDAQKRIGDRCFRWKDALGNESIEFIRNNIYITVTGIQIRIEALVRDLDRQIVELSEKVKSDLQPSSSLTATNQKPTATNHLPRKAEGGVK